MSPIPVTMPSSRGRARTVTPGPAHIEIVSTRQQRRARPRLGAAVVTVGGLFVILAAQLLLTIATSDGAYQISALQAHQAELARDEQVLIEQLQVLDAPQHLATEAHGLGMVSSSSAAYLRLADGAILGAPMQAVASSAFLTAPDGTPLIPDSLLAGIPLASAKMQAEAAGVGTGAPAADGGAGSVASTPPVGIPSPVTH